MFLTEMVSATRKQAVNPRRCVQYVLTEWQTKLQLETSNWDHCDLQPTAACEIKKRLEGYLQRDTCAICHAHCHQRGTCS